VLEHEMSTTRAMLGSIVMAVAVGCTQGPTTILERLSDARALASEAMVQLTKAADASNCAVMAGNDETAAGCAKDADRATAAVQTNTALLRPLLAGLGYSKESRLLDEFDARFEVYRELDREILGMAADSSNVTAQRLSFGPAREHADAVGHALESIAPLDTLKQAATRPAGGPEASALAAIVMMSVREIQALQAPHIAEPNDAPMTLIEQRMSTLEETTRRALQALASTVPASAQPNVKAAAAAFDQFMKINAEILTLSRRNSNVRALALALGKKRTLVAACDESLRALQDALAKRGFTGTR
jgi:hypothetical protein